MDIPCLNEGIYVYGRKSVKIIKKQEDVGEKMLSGFV